MSTESLLSSQTATGEVASAFDPEQEKAKLRDRGVALMSSVMGSRLLLLATRRVIETTTEGDKERGQVRLSPRQGAIPGGWHEIPGSKLARLTLLHPKDIDVSGPGFVSVDVADIELFNGTKFASNQRNVRVAMDEAGVPHVTGTSSMRFDLDGSAEDDARLMYGNLRAAKTSFDEAEASLQHLTAPPQPSLPPAQ